MDDPGALITYTARCPGCGEDTDWTVGTPLGGEMFYGIAVRAMRYSFTCPCAEDEDGDVAA